MSPLLFSLYADEKMEDVQEGIQIRGYWLKYVRFADD